MLKRSKKNASLELLRLIVSSLVYPRLNASSAACSYYALFVPFPMMILLVSLTNRFQLTTSLGGLIAKFFPSQTQEGILEYCGYVEANSSLKLFIFGLVFLLYFSWRLLDFISANLSNLFDPEHTPSLLRRFPRTFSLSLIFSVLLPVLLCTLVFGNRLMTTLGADNYLSVFALTLWQYIRLPLATLLMYLLLLLVYRFCTFPIRKARDILPGATLGLLLWFLVSLVFSFYLEHLGDYSFLYGTLGSAIALLVWIYFTAYSFFFGAVFN